MVWLNGSLMPLHEARISPLDHGLLVGDGVFETLVARHGQLFAVHEHWERLIHSCVIMGLKPVPEEEFITAMQAVLEANQLFFHFFIYLPSFFRLIFILLLTGVCCAQLRLNRHCIVLVCFVVFLYP